MLRAFLARPQEAIHKRHLVYCVCYVSWLLPGLEWNWCRRPSAVWATPPEDEQVMLETCSGI
jgi:hypothetical protein